MDVFLIFLAVFFAGLLLVAIYDLLQTRHAILRNFPIIGHMRYWLESAGPELRQYIVADNNSERPFSRDQRSWVYASAKNLDNLFGYGSDENFEAPADLIIIKQSDFPHKVALAGEYDPQERVPSPKVLGAFRQRAKAFRPSSLVNISGMSFGSLSGAAVEAMNRGSSLAGCLHNTGEGGISPHHLHGGDLIWQIGTGYFGCRDSKGAFDLVKFKDAVASSPIRAVEIKLNQGAFPSGHAVLPGSKVSPQVAAIRGVPAGRACVSPVKHSAFSDTDSLLDFVERLAEVSGLPVGIKAAVGRLGFWKELVDLISETGRAVDFVTIDGGEGGTGAAPLAMSDSMALPFQVGFSRVYREFALRGLKDEITFIGSGKLGFPQVASLALAFGCDMINVGRTAMLSVGCIQAQRCHTGHCPAGVATQNPWLARGLDPTSKSVRLANYVITLRRELLQIARACGAAHPCLVDPRSFELLIERFRTAKALEFFDVEPEWCVRPEDDSEEITRLMAEARTIAAASRFASTP